MVQVITGYQRFTARCYMLLLALLLPLAGRGQVTIAAYDFENAAGTPPVSGGTTYTGSSTASDGPASSTFAVAGTAYGVSNGTATITSATVDASSYTGITVSFRLASFSIGSTGNGADSGDNVQLAISTDGTTFTEQVRVAGNANAYWHYTTGAATATRAFSGAAATTFGPSGGGARTTDGYSTVSVTGIAGSANLRFRITLLNNAAAERWVIDDIRIAGTVAPPAAPTLTTDAASPVSYTTATLNGNISSFGNPTGASPAYGFVYSRTADNATPALGGTGTTTVTKGTASFIGDFSSAVSGLTQSTGYSYRAYATNGTGTSYGAVQTFTTLTPTITTGSVGGAPVCVSTAPASLTVNYTTAGNITGTYSAQLSDAAGSFATPLTLAITSSTATQLTVTIPQGTANGTGYRIRVNNTTPATTGSNSAAFTINNLSVSVAPASLGLNLGQTNATALTATETPSATSRIWKYGTVSGTYPNTIGGQTGTSYTPQPADFGNVQGTYYVVAVSTLGACTITSAPATVTVGPPTSAYITVNPNTLSLGTVGINTPGTIQTYQVNGVVLSTGITITPPVGVEISRDGFVTTANTNASPLVLSQSGGTVPTTTISVRLAATATPGAVAGNITNVSGTGSASVAVSGTVSAGGTTCVNENFNSFTGTTGTLTSGATGWTATGLTSYTGGAQSGIAPNAARFDDTNDQLITPLLSGPASSLSFFAQGNGTDATSSLLIEGFNGTTYSTIATLSSLPTTGTTFTYNASSTPALPAGVYTRFRFTYTKSAGNLSFDDLVVSCGAGSTLVLTTGTIAGSPFCVNQSPGTSISVPYTVSGGSFGTGNVFTATISSDNFATETVLGTRNAVTSGTITGSIPNSVTTGSTYRVRVKASTPATSAGDNGTDLTVTNYLTNEVASATAVPGNNSATLTFTGPAACAVGAIVTIRPATTGTKPLASTVYSASTTYGSGTQLASGQYVVYNGAASGSVTVSGLSNGTLYIFEVFTTGGASGSASGYSNGTLRSVRPVLPATLTEVVVPQLISGRPTSGSDHTTRLPYVWRASISGLVANTTYKYYTAVRAAADPLGFVGVGIPVETRVAGAFVRGTGPGLVTASSTFTTDGSGAYTGWFGLEPSADTRFNDGATLYPMVVLNAGDGANVETHFLPTTSPVTARLLATGSTQATAVRGSSFGTPGNFVLTYDNTTGTGRPLAGTWLESDGTDNTTNYAGFYSSSVNGVAGAYGLLTPNTNAAGIRRVEQRSLADGSLVGCAATDADGTWPSGVNTVTPPTGGTTARVLTTGDTPFQVVTVSSFTPSSGSVVTTTVTITGTNFTTTPRPTVSFNGGTPVTAATVSADGTTLTVVVPSGATTGPLTVTGGCGTGVTSASTFTVVPTVFYTKATGNVNVLATYGDQPDGSGVAPTSFATSGLTFNVNGTGRTFASNWTVGTGSKVVIGTGAELIIPAAATFIGTIDQSATSTLTIRNATTAGITQGVQSATSTIDLAQTGALYTVPTTLTYQNLKLTGGEKRIPAVVTVNGSLTFENTIISGSFANASNVAGSYATVQLFGAFNQLAGVSYDNTRSITLHLMNLTTAQNLNGNGNTIELYRLYTAAAGAGSGAGVNSGAKGGILTGTGTVLQLGNSFDGGLALYESTASLALNAGTTLRFAPGGGGNIFENTLGVLKPDPGANLEFYRNTPNVYTLGILRFASGFTTVNNFLLNSVAAGANTLELTSNLIVNGTMTLDNGTLIIGSNTLTLNGLLSAATGGFLNGGTSSNLTIGGSGNFGTLSFASGARLLHNLTMNRAGGTLTLGAPLTVSGTLALTNGVVTTSTANLLTLTTSGSITGGSASSHINGPLARATLDGARTVLFPIGKGGNYRPLTLLTSSQTAAPGQLNTVTYTAEQFETAPSASSLSGGLTRVSSRRYFNLTPAVPPATYNGMLIITFGTDDFVNYPAHSSLVIAKRTDAASPWINIGRSTNTGTANAGQPVAGTLTSGSFTSFSDFALASTSTANGFPGLNPLPVELTSFSASRQATGVALNWATALEKDNAYFEVERSLDGKSFGAVARVEGHGTSTRALTYTSLDANAPQHLLYYRLRQVDTDGKATLSAVVTVAPGAASDFAVFPNPTRGLISFATAAGRPFRILNQLGQPVLKGETTAGHTTTTVDQLPAGSYFLELQTGKGRVVRKFVKE